MKDTPFCLIQVPTVIQNFILVVCFIFYSNNRKKTNILVKLQQIYFENFKNMNKLLISTSGFKLIT